MLSLRARFYYSTGILLALQAMTAALTLASWRAVLRTAAYEADLSAERDVVIALGDAVREQYVHQTHTFIEGGPAHLGHHAEIERAVETALERVEALPVAGDLTSPLRSSIDQFQEFFHTDVEPAARASTLTRTEATALHGKTERLADEVSDELNSVLASIDRAQEEGRAHASKLTAQAWALTAALLIGALGSTLWIARSLAVAVLVPVTGLREAAHQFGAGDTAARAPDGGDVELREVAAAFNRMISDVRRAEEVRVRNERLLALGEMSAAIAHELMNPLMVILGHPGLDGPALAPVKHEAEHARRVVDGLLGFARPGEEPIASVDIAELTRESVDRLLPRADSVDVHLALDARLSLPATTSPSAVRQVLDNLILNAIEASPPGSRVEVEVSDRKVRVLDRGAGIPVSVRDRLYEPFATGRPGGTGLGLAVCQRIARTQGGAIRHDDREGGGTVATWEVGGA